MPTSQADVATARPSRYLTQLCKHFAHKVHAEYDYEHGVATFEAGTCAMDASDGHLRLRAEASDDSKLQHVQAVVGNHLERFGERDALAVHWTPAPDEHAS